MTKPQYPKVDPVADFSIHSGCKRKLRSGNRRICLRS